MNLRSARHDARRGHASCTRSSESSCRSLVSPCSPQWKLSWASESQEEGGTGEFTQTCSVPEGTKTRSRKALLGERGRERRPEASFGCFDSGDRSTPSLTDARHARRLVSTQYAHQATETQSSGARLATVPATCASRSEISSFERGHVSAFFPPPSVNTSWEGACDRAQRKS